MDLAFSYDHIVNTDDRAATPTPPKPLSSNDDATTDDPTTPRPTQSQPARQNLQTEFQETFKAFSSSPWGAKLGGLWGNVRKQGESYYEEAVREAEAARVDAIKGFSDIREGIAGRVRSLSISEKDALQDAEAKALVPEQPRTPIPGEEPIPGPHDDASGDVLQETETLLKRFKAEAAKRLRDVQHAEDAADEALLRFGTTIRNFLHDAVTVTTPEDDEQPGSVLFESKDSSGKRTIHASRMDAQLHTIHTTKDGFMQDPLDSGEQWTSFKKSLDVEQRTEDIARDLDEYPELRRTMETLVPEKVEYPDFWARYYFLRQALEAQEEKRRELLKASAANPESLPSWDEDSDDEPAPQSKSTNTKPSAPTLVAQNTNDSSSTINQPPPQPSSTTSSTTVGAGGLKPEVPTRRSHDEKSVADSEASYDIVSGAPSRAASSPKEREKELKGEESDDDWE